jgi:hypothetical protein
MESFNQELDIGVLPNNIKNLNMQNFNQELKLGYIPHSVNTLILNSFNKTLNDPNIIPSVYHLTINNLNYVNIENFQNKFILISSSNRPYILSNNKCITYLYNYDFDYHIINYISKQFIHNNFLGKHILNELTQIVFNPKRLQKLCHQYNLDLDDLLSCY